MQVSYTSCFIEILVQNMKQMVFIFIYYTVANTYSYTVSINLEQSVQDLFYLDQDNVF